MPEALTFLMGKHPANLPGELHYCRNHMWVCPAPDGAVRVGFSAYAVRLMQDVYFLEWSVDADSSVAAKAPIGYIETSKAQSELYAPFAGTITQFNTALLNDPSAINTDGYGDGWLFEMAASPDDLMPAADYHAFLADAWITAQRVIKGQVNTIEDESE